MGFFSKVEDRPTPKEVYNWKVYAYAAVASAGAATIGYDSAFIGGTLSLESFKSAFNFGALSSEEVGLISANIVSCYQAGAFFGAFAAYPAGHFLGRRIGLAIFALVFLLGAGVMLAVASHSNLGYLYGGRVLAGFGIGGISNIIPIYISEISPPAIRGRLVGMWEIGWQAGGLLGFWINYALNNTMAPSRKQWVIPFAIQLIPAGLLMIGTFVLVESPRWLIHNGRREAGIKSLSRLRGLPATDIYMKEEIAQVDQSIELQRSTIGMGFWAPFQEVTRNKKIMWRLFLGSSLFFWQNGSGINAINYYSPTVFRSIGITGTNTGLFTTGIFGIIKTAMTFVWIAIMIDQLGRRKLLMIGGLGGGVSMFVVAGYIAVAKPSTKPTTADAKLTSGGIAAMAFFYIYTLFYTPSWSGTPWVVNSEMFDQNVRTLAQACAAASNWFWNFLVARFTPQMFSSMGFGVWIFFASLQLLSIPFVYFLLPETKSVPLEQMDLLFSNNLTPRKAHKVVMENLRLMDEEFRNGNNVFENDTAKRDIEAIEQQVENVSKV